MKTLRVGVVIAKFQPLLKGQVEHLLKPALQNSDMVVVLLGSSGVAKNCFNPFDENDRRSMISSGIASQYPIPVYYEAIRDFLYSETPVDWITQCQSKIKAAVNQYEDYVIGKRVSNIEVSLYGAESFEQEKEYHGWYPNWKIVVSKVEPKISYEEVLTHLWESQSAFSNDPFLKEHLTPEVIDFLALDWKSDSDFQKLQAEYFYVKDYKARTQNGKYPIIFQTVDNVCYYKGFVLLVKRKSQPGKNTWALPGGFLNAEESCRIGAMRELQEETGLKVKPEWFISRDVFDHPKRSIRGRTITNAFLWKIPDSRQVPQIAAGSDAAKAQWFPLADVIEKMPEQIFEDHLDIIMTLTKRL